ncbi:MAG: hypothetical protein JJ900_16300 [Rhodospirillales bacterium]|nr:hypothetical protein [Rhodospirillales bacterium]MBO6788411.1 hypothetical protein [Rhodospirillales bacterium]
MIDRDRRRRLVHLLIGINGAGFVLVGTLLGGSGGLGYVPWYGIAGAAMMFVGVVVPFYREFTSLRHGFEEVEREALKTFRRNRHREIGHQTVLDAGSRPQPFARVRSQPLVTILITLIAWGLAAYEALRWLT